MSAEEKSAPEEPRQDSLLSRISSEIVRMFKQYYGKGPERAKSYMLDDFLLVVMRGGVLRAEKTMLASGEEQTVRHFRQRFEDEMGPRLTALIEDLTGRTVVNYQSQVLFDPDIVLEIFFFDAQAEREAVAQTARAQLGDEPSGEVTSDDVPDQPLPADLGS